MRSAKIKEYIDRHTFKSEEHGDILFKTSVERAVCDSENEIKKNAINAFCRFLENYFHVPDGVDRSEILEYCVIEYVKLLNATE